MRTDIQNDSKRRIASILIQVADAGLLAWCAMAALLPKHLIGPGGAPILEVGYERFTQSSWQELSPKAAEFLTMIFRLYGAYGVAFSLVAIAIAATAFRRGERWAWGTLLLGNTIAYPVAMVYDQVVNAVGPFEMLEYVGLGAIYVALAMTVPRGQCRTAEVPS